MTQPASRPWSTRETDLREGPPRIASIDRFVVVTLDSGTLPSIGAGVAVPSYDRSCVTACIVHMGVGGFHRAHQVACIDRPVNKGKAFDRGIIYAA